jgi:hypothetical protein
MRRMLTLRAQHFKVDGPVDMAIELDAGAIELAVDTSTIQFVLDVLDQNLAAQSIAVATHEFQSDEEEGRDHLYNSIKHAQSISGDTERCANRLHKHCCRTLCPMRLRNTHTHSLARAHAHTHTRSHTHPPPPHTHTHTHTQHSLGRVKLVWQ